MSGYALTPLAQADVFQIWAFIAHDSEEAADGVEQSIYEACAFLAQALGRGHMRRDLTARPVPFWTLARYSTI
jgi:antitoxin ParD1/3/4